MSFRGELCNVVECLNIINQVHEETCNFNVYQNSLSYFIRVLFYSMNVFSRMWEEKYPFFEECMDIFWKYTKKSDPI